MPKKIQVIEVREYVYDPDPLDYVDGVFPNGFTIEEALKLDKEDVTKRIISLADMADEIKVVGRTWRIIDEP